MTTPTKATKAATKRARPAATTKRARSPKIVPAADPAPEQPAAPGTIQFRGRRIAVKRPSVEQLGMWQVTADELTRLQSSEATPQRAAKLLARAIRLISSVMADEADRDWLQDSIMDGELNLADAADILPLAASEFVNAAPTTGPAPKAARRR